MDRVDLLLSLVLLSGGPICYQGKVGHDCHTVKSTKRIFSLKLTFFFPMFCHICDEPEMIVSDQH